MLCRGGRSGGITCRRRRRRLGRGFWSGGFVGFSEKEYPGGRERGKKGGRREVVRGFREVVGLVD